jgi:hypothetical protein
VVSSCCQPETDALAMDCSVARLAVPVWLTTPPKRRKARIEAVTTPISGSLARSPAWLSSRPSSTPTAPAAR